MRGLNKGMPIHITGNNEQSKPGWYSVDMIGLRGVVSDELRNIVVDVSTCEISDVADIDFVAAYLVGLTISALHVMVQPCYKPDEESLGLYPP